jgi:dipeptidase
MITHNDDSSSADYRLWIIPALDWPEGSMRDIVLDGHNYIDYSNWPEVDYGDKAMVMGQTPQVEHTYAYFHSRYSFMNEMGVAMGESTFSVGKHMPNGEEINRVMVEESPGIIDCWYAQDIALERAKTAREAVRIMGDLVEEYGWYGDGETINITDGDEVWIAEFYGRDIWCAVRIPNDHFFVAANMARITEVDFDDHENYMYSPNIVSFAVEQGWYDPNSGEPFSPADIYAPNDQLYSTRRVWRAFKLVAPSLDIDPDDVRFPFSVKPEKKLSVHDIFKIKGDYYKGTDYDISTGPAAGPFGDPLKYPNTPGHNERAISIMRTCYIHIGEVDPSVPAPFKGIRWYGYGSPDSTYIVPLWPVIKNFPEGYQIGSRYEPFCRDSYWWTNTWVRNAHNLSITKLLKNFTSSVIQN